MKKNSSTSTEHPSLSILLIEEDINWGNFLKSHLERQGFQVHLSLSGSEGIQAQKTGQYNFCICNMSLPDVSGFSVIALFRQKSKHLPILLLSNQGTEEDRIRGFKLGADECISRPCNMEELIFRILSIHKRYLYCPLEEDTHVFDLGRYTFDHTAQMLYNKRKKIDLSTKEADLLQVLCLHKNKVTERYSALQVVWQNTSMYASKSLDVYISKVRHLIEAHTDARIINQHGVGYKLLVPSTDTQKKSSKKSSSAKEPRTKRLTKPTDTKPTAISAPEDVPNV